MALSSRFRHRLSTAIILFVVSLQTQASKNTPSEQTLKMGAQHARQIVLSHKEKIIALANNQQILAFLKENSECQKSLTEIVTKDKEWPLSSALQRRITTNPVAQIFQSIIEDKNFNIAELMLVGGFGELIAAYPVPSDYWQGDEPKFYEPLKRQDVYVSSANWDFSTQSHSFFISLPIIENGVIIGVLVAGLDVSLEYMMQLRLEDLIEINFNPGHPNH